MTRCELSNNYKELIETQHMINTDKTAAIKAAWDMCMDMGRQHGFSDVVSHECWCRAMEMYDRTRGINKN